LTDNAKDIDAAPDLGSVVPLSSDTPPGQTKDFKQTHQKARQLERQNWVGEIEKEYLGGGMDGIVFIFLFKVRPSRPGNHSWTWVIAGDLPSAYITCEDSKTPFGALDGYIGAMEQWVAAARAGKSVEHLIPVNVPPTAKNAEMLGGRLKFLDENILPLLRK